MPVITVRDGGGVVIGSGHDGRSTNPAVISAYPPYFASVRDEYEQGHTGWNHASSNPIVKTVTKWILGGIYCAFWRKAIIL